MSNDQEITIKLTVDNSEVLKAIAEVKSELFPLVAMGIVSDLAKSSYRWVGEYQEGDIRCADCDSMRGDPHEPECVRFRARKAVGE